MKHQAEKEGIKAIVGDVFPNRGYATAYPDGDQRGVKSDESITFSLRDWSNRQIAPRKGQCIIIDDATRYAKGWRAEGKIELVTTARSQSSSMEQK